jgi:hypothetical protein
MRDNIHMASNGEISVPRGISEVELKVTLDATVADDPMDKLDLEKDDDKAKKRTIWFFEGLDAHGSPSKLPLLKRGIILRVRGKRDGSGGSTLKLRGPEGCLDPVLWERRLQAFGGAEDAKIEGDWAADRRLVAASLDGEVEAGIDELVAGRPAQLSRRFTEAQTTLARELLVELDGLVPLGPIDAWKWDPGAGKLDAEVEAERWEIEDGPRFLELSMRVAVADGPAALRRLRKTVQDAGLTIDDAETKTETVLHHFADKAGQRR